MLAELGCGIAQGYLISPAVPGEELADDGRPLAPTGQS